ncbi:MAG: bifunctional phosphoribosylaminoimidazolecarboxamide formyltransferase/IMP cyclohydrolase [Granulosicoccaceae bacterium]
MPNVKKRFALLSVSDKNCIAVVAKALTDAGVGLLSTGGTASLLRDHGFEVLEVADYTGASEMMAGRVKTLHPMVHGGILGRRGIDDDVMQERGITHIDYVIVNLYPFERTVAKPSVEFDDAIENIDIGGPAMVRAAAKNHAHVTVVTDPSDYDRVVASLAYGSEANQQLRFELAVKAFEHTARYDGMIASYLGRLSGPAGGDASVFSNTLNAQYELVHELRYGENPHQRAALYKQAKPPPGSIAAANLVQGKPMSFNNVVDADSALACVKQFERPACVIVKHANPCGVSVSAEIVDAYQAAYATDPTSAFGGIIAFNRSLDKKTSEAITAQQFVEVIIAPSIDEDAKSVLAGFPNVRVLETGPESAPLPMQLKAVSGGLLVQDEDTKIITVDDLTIVTKREPSPQEIADLLFTWRVAKFVKSNAIVYGKDLSTVGVGAGQMSRVYSARIAAIKAHDAGLDVKGAVMASDAFFPFRDGIDNAAEVGVSAVIQPGGSKNDQQVIDAANEHGMAMVLTGVRHFRH